MYIFFFFHSFVGLFYTISFVTVSHVMIVHVYLSFLDLSIV